MQLTLQIFADFCLIVQQTAPRFGKELEKIDIPKYRGNYIQYNARNLSATSLGMALESINWIHKMPGWLSFMAFNVVV